MNVLVAGGTGLIGQVLVKQLMERDHAVTVLSRNPSSATMAGVDFIQWDGHSGSALRAAVGRTDAIVNLAGENIGGGRWTEERKTRIRQSRVRAGEGLVQAIRDAERKPSTFVQASALGYYGSLYKNETLRERMPAGTDFLASVCVDWENSSQSVRELGVRLVVARLGVVLARDGGALPSMVLPFRLGLGGALGDGAQPFPWIHVADAAGALAYMVERETLAGPFNLTGSVVSNREFSRLLAQTLRRPLMLDVPAWAVRRLFGEQSVILLTGQNAPSHRLREAGYAFAFPDLAPALGDLFP